MNETHITPKQLLVVAQHLRNAHNSASEAKEQACRVMPTGTRVQYLAKTRHHWATVEFVSVFENFLYVHATRDDTGKRVKISMGDIVSIGGNL